MRGRANSLRKWGTCLIAGASLLIAASDAAAQAAPRYFGGMHASSAAQPRFAAQSAGMMHSDAYEMQQYQTGTAQPLSNQAAYQNAMSDVVPVSYNAATATATDANVIPGAEVPEGYAGNHGNCNSCDSGGCDSSGDCGCGSDCHEPEVWYVGLSGAWQERKTVHEIGQPATFLEWKDGFAMNVSIGRRFDAFRLEGEVSFMNNRIDLSGAGIPGVGDFIGPAAGNVSLTSYMFNAYHDIKIKDWCWEPYVGAGIGFYQSEINSLYPIYFPEIGAADGGVNSKSDFPFAYQFRVGATRPLTERTEFFIGYRYFNGGDLSFAGEPFGPFAPDSGITSHVEAGLRVNF